MIVDGYVTELHLTGDFAQAVQWQPFAVNKLRDILRAGRLTQGVMVLGTDVKMRYFINRSSKLAKVWVDAAKDLGHAIAFFPTKLRTHADGYLTNVDSYGKPYKDADGEAINDPIGTLNGTAPGWMAKPSLYDVPGYVAGTPITYTITKAPVAKGMDRLYWGCNDWVHTEAVAGGDYKLLGYVTFGNKQGRSNNILRYNGDRYRSPPYTFGNFLPSITNAPAWAGSTANMYVYYNGKRVVEDAPGAVLGAAIVDKVVGDTKKRYVIGVSAGTTHSVQFSAAYGNPGKTAPKNYLLWVKELNSTDSLRVVGTVASVSPTKFFDYAPLFAFNRSATKCSAVIRTYFPAVNTDFSGYEDPDTNLGPSVFHVDWTDIEAPVVTSEAPVPAPPDISTSVAGGDYWTADEPTGGFVNTTGGVVIPSQTLAIDYRGDTEVRLMYESASTASTSGVTTVESVYALRSEQLAVSSKTDSYTISGSWSVGGSLDITTSTYNHVADNGELIKRFNSDQTTKEIHVVYLDLRYPVIVWYEIDKTQTTAQSAGPGLYLGNFRYLAGTQSQSCSSVYHLYSQVGSDVQLLDTTNFTSSYTNDAWWVYASREGIPIYGGAVNTESSINFPEVHVFPLNHNTWVNLNLVDGEYYGYTTDYAPYYSSYMPSATAGVLVKANSPLEIDAMAYSIAYRPMKCGFRGESLFDRKEEYYVYASLPDGLRESGKLDLLTPLDNIRSVGIGR